MLDEFLNKIIVGDCIEIMKRLPNESVDLIFADPPYNMQLDNTLMRFEGTEFKGVKDDLWDKFSSIKEYAKFSKEWITECKRIMKKNASLWIIGSFQNIYIVGNILQEMDFWIFNDIIWNKQNPVPNFSGARFTNAHETLLWVVKNKTAKPTFNYKTMKEYNGGKQMKSVWDIPLCTGKERLKNDEGIKLHSTQKPEELLRRVILSTSKEGDIILDPFFGTGTTGAVAKRLKRRYIGIEMDTNYAGYAQKRIDIIFHENISKYNEIESKPAKVTHKMLLDSGLIKENQELHSKNGDFFAVWKGDGKVAFENEILSIHIASARCLKKANNNGWTYWHVKKGDTLVCIDTLREEYRKKYNI